ncbi:unnamed protein product [Penicillium salamii]|nr:unnamed protein product [Penicillium salamii]CAG8377486.1 unnamed protein product [Penicillium salamii]
MVITSYSLFREAHPDGDPRPAFHDEDGIPLYETPYQALLNEIVNNNDTAYLRLYSDSPTTKVFWGGYEPPYNHPFILASAGQSVEVPKALLEIYMTDSTLQEPIYSYLARIKCSPMNDACAAGNRDPVGWLLSHDPPLGTLHDCMAGSTPLFSAAQQLGDQGDYAGTLAARHGKRDQIARMEDFMCFLLDLGCSVPDSDLRVLPFDAKDSSHLDQPRAKVVYTVLGAAIPHASYRMVSRLIAEGADVQVSQNWSIDSESIGCGLGVTVLHIAALYWNLDGIQALAGNLGEVGFTKLASTPDDSGQLPLHWALAGAETRRIEILGREDQEEVTAHITRTVEVLLQANPDALASQDREGLTVLHYAVTSAAGLASILPVVKILLHSNPALPSISTARNSRGWTLLGSAIDRHARRHGRPSDQLLELLVLLLDNGADGRAWNTKSQNSLHTAAMLIDTDYADIAIIDKLLELVDVNHVDVNGHTSLHLMVRRLDRIDAVRHLIRRGANVNMSDHKGNSPLHEVMHGRIAQRAFENGEVEPIDRDKRERMRAEMIQVMFDAGASMYHFNTSRQTPLELLDELIDKETRQLQSLGRGRGRWRREHS